MCAVRWSEERSLSGCCCCHHLMMGDTRVRRRVGELGGRASGDDGGSGVLVKQGRGRDSRVGSWFLVVVGGGHAVRSSGSRVPGLRGLVGVWDIDGKGHVLLRVLNVMLGYLKGIPADRHRRVLVRDGRTATIGNVDLQSGRFDIAVLMKVVVSTHVVLVIFFLGNFHLEFKFATEDDTKAVRAWRLINARESGTITPFVKLAAEGIAFSFAGPQFSACEESMAT